MRVLDVGAGLRRESRQDNISPGIWFYRIMYLFQVPEDGDEGLLMEMAKHERKNEWNVNATCASLLNEKGVNE